MRNNEDLHVYYGCSSLLMLFLIICVVLMSAGAALSNSWNLAQAAKEQRLTAEAWRDGQIGVAQAQEQGATDRAKIASNTTIRTHWSYIPNRFVDIILTIFVAVTILFALSRFLVVKE